MNELETKALFLGILSAEKPLPFNLACEEAEGEQAGLKPLWEKLQKDVKGARKTLMAVDSPSLEEKVVQTARLGDLFLTGYTLCGMDLDEMSNEDAAELLDEMEDHVMLMDDWLAEKGTADGATWAQDGEKYHREFLELWAELQDAL